MRAIAIVIISLSTFIFLNCTLSTENHSGERPFIKIDKWSKAHDDFSNEYFVSLSTRNDTLIGMSAYKYQILARDSNSKSLKVISDYTHSLYDFRNEPVMSKDYLITYESNHKSYDWDVDSTYPETNRIIVHDVMNPYINSEPPNDAVLPTTIAGNLVDIWGGSGLPVALNGNKGVASFVKGTVTNGYTYGIIHFTITPATPEKPYPTIVADTVIEISNSHVGWGNIDVVNNKFYISSTFTLYILDSTLAIDTIYGGSSSDNIDRVFKNTSTNDLLGMRYPSDDIMVSEDNGKSWEIKYETWKHDLRIVYYSTINNLFIGRNNSGVSQFDFHDDIIVEKIINCDSLQLDYYTKIVEMESYVYISTRKHGYMIDKESFFRYKDTIDYLF